MKDSRESIIFKVSIQDRLELDELVRRLGFPSRHAFFLDIVRGTLTAVDNQDRGSLFVYIPVPRTLMQKYFEKNESLQEIVVKLILSLT
ncbi:hypothetical protein SFV1gp22 [Sulfolobus filamentous virus 1]|uniref:Uncharacterized protein n=2 Tax=Alphalipothrixvirus beppuense TaxID=2734584 RepID=A0A346LU61_SUFV1|nr:hypothetical protein HOT91_gp22 [Sulfolobus filamentous virus 1]AXQ00104.1 hypothetical protein SFV1gp22 [Sulfolobus filamentous virus 1]AZI75724.1 hypothetical protein SBFV1_gp23 [Sulfolobales Beppu filamentous phage 1]